MSFSESFSFSFSLFAIQSEITCSFFWSLFRVSKRESTSGSEESPWQYKSENAKYLRKNDVLLSTFSLAFALSTKDTPRLLPLLSRL